MMANLRVAPYNEREVLVAVQVDSKGNPTSETHHSWVTQLILSGPATLAVNTPGTYTVTVKDYLGNALSLNDSITIQTTDANGDKQTIQVQIANGTGTFQFSSAAAGTFALAGTGQTTAGVPYDCNGLEVTIS